MIGLDHVRRAAERIRPFVVRTPLERSAALSDAFGAEVWLKFECFQYTGAFKIRGALSALLELDVVAVRARGVVAASAGNHGLGVARAARQLGVPATVVVPETASAAKTEALSQAGIELLLRGSDYDAAERAGRELAQERGLPFISAYNDPMVVAGGGTVALEILEDLPETRAMVVPVGGGGLIGGMGVAGHGLDPTVLVYGVQSEASPALHTAWTTGRLIPVAVEPSLADGLAGNVEADTITLELLQRHLARMALVSEADIARAMRFCLEREHVLVEGSAAVGVAAVLDRRIPSPSGPTVIVLTGRNVSAKIIQEVLRS